MYFSLHSNVLKILILQSRQNTGKEKASRSWQQPAIWESWTIHRRLLQGMGAATCQGHQGAGGGNSQDGGNRGGCSETRSARYTGRYRADWKEGRKALWTQTQSSLGTPHGARLMHSWHVSGTHWHPELWSKPGNRWESCCS